MYGQPSIVKIVGCLVKAGEQHHRKAESLLMIKHVSGIVVSLVYLDLHIVNMIS